MLKRLYRSLANRRRGANEPRFWLWRAFEWTVDRLAAVLANRRGIRFPEQRMGGWWWTGRWRFEFVLGWLEPESIEWVRRLVRPGMTVVDVGAHIGFYTRILSDLVGPNGRVLAFEPHPANLDLLRHNTGGMSNVEVHAFAVGASDEPVRLHVSAGHSNHSLIDGYTEELESIEVEGITLDSFLAHHQIAAIDFLKIDVEGAEPLVLAGLAGALDAKRVRGILTEFNPIALELGGAEPAKYVRTLRESGFDVHSIGPDGRLEDPLVPGTVVNLLCLPVD